MKHKLHLHFKQIALVPVLLLLTSMSWAQSKISGRLVDEKGKPVPGASVYLDNTIDGGTSDSSGSFSFSTEEKGQQTLVATEVSHENGGLPININGDMSGLEVKMKGQSHQLDEVMITAGSIEASDRNNTVLKPLDIVTTAGAQADIVKAIQTLPGTQQQGAQTGLFVRGGDASEAAVVVDGLVAQNAFLSTAPGVAARSRFGAFQFKGVAFSSGGYSARYGQALSSVLELNSNDLPDKSTVNLGVNMAGVYASASKLFKKTSVEGTAYYNNLTPFYGIASTNFDFYDVPKGGGGSAKFTYKPNEKGILKALVNYSTFSSGTRIPSTDSNEGGKTMDYGLTNQNVYSSISYKQNLKDKWNLYIAGSYSYNQDDAKFDTNKLLGTDDRMQLRAEVKRYITSRFDILLGTEIQHFSYDRNFTDSSNTAYKNDFTETQSAGYLEINWAPIYWLAFKPGVRYEHSALLKTDAISPRFAMAIRAGEHGQFSLATGIFYQTADQNYLFVSRPGYQKAVHYIANYQFTKNDRTLRLEGYYKDYQQLIKEKLMSGMSFNPNTTNRFIPYNTMVSNSGTGYATGAELFWRDRKSIKNADYWVSYSYIDTRRLYKNYPFEATPDFISDHNLSVVGKYFIEKWQTQINATYSFATGKPYFNPALGAATVDNFMSDRTPAYHNLSIGVNYLTTIGKKWFTVVYAGVDNVTNHKNIFGYRYDAAGKQYEIRPALYRSVFVGVNFSLTAFDKDEL
ncbi:MAG: TonB-dependent receptor [Sphingobacteriales bacterium]|nr:MAG: TonB-dependent receptor [Sphingobacteriales bacterium]